MANYCVSNARCAWAAKSLREARQIAKRAATIMAHDMRADGVSICLHGRIVDCLRYGNSGYAGGPEWYWTGPLGKTEGQKRLEELRKQR